MNPNFESIKCRASRKYPIGSRYGKLVIIGAPFIISTGNPGSERNHSHVVCACDCGKFTSANTDKLRGGSTKSCGCLRTSNPRFSFLQHGGYKTKLYNIWRSMRKRCRCEKTRHFHRYGGRGITVCEEWMDFGAFRLWAKENGYEAGLSIDRIDPDLGYCPENCQFITRSANSKKTWTDREEKISELQKKVDRLSAIVARLCFSEKV